MGVSAVAIACLLAALLSWALATTGTAVWYARAFSQLDSPVEGRARPGTAWDDGDRVGIG
jgi:hypothetical protein